MTAIARGGSTSFQNIYAGKKVLVTGHTGFKGSWLSEWLLLLGADVTGYAIDCAQPLFNDLGLAKRMRDERGDVRDVPKIVDLIESLRPDFIFHLAAQPLVRHSYADPVGTFSTNFSGTVNVLEALRLSTHRCVAVMITTDKVYENLETGHAYRESDPLGGHDPYSASKAAAEIAIDSYRKSFFSNENPLRVALASARAGNVIGGGDWAEDRLVPDCVRALQKGSPIPIRNRNSTRPWQHVLDPLNGYLTLGAALWAALDSKTVDPVLCSAFNFGPARESNRTVGEVVAEVLKLWPGKAIDKTDGNAPHEAEFLNLAIDKAAKVLKWNPVWNFEQAISKTIEWYRTAKTVDPAELTRRQINDFTAPG